MKDEEENTLHFEFTAQDKLGRNIAFNKDVSVNELETFFHDLGVAFNMIFGLTGHHCFAVRLLNSAKVSSKIQAIKYVRVMTGASLVEAKDLVDKNGALVFKNHHDAKQGVLDYAAAAGCNAEIVNVVPACQFNLDVIKR